MAEPKNPFDFGTGSIDKDQWLRDIDAEQDAFISRYSGAVNKHRATLLRDAFTDLRRRIANGDMLNRTADGLYQFGSALNREDKHMQEAYQRALGFMGGLARRQIQTPPATEPEKKKYSPKTLNDRFIRYFNPSGSQESFTSLWNSYDDVKRKLQLLSFLRNELSNLEKNYLDVEDYDSMDNLKTRINDFIADPNITNLNRLGFTRNYLNLLQTEEQLEEAPKSELEQVKEDMTKAEEALQVLQGRQYLNWLKYRGNPLKWEFETKPYDYQGMFNYNRRNGNIKTSYLFLTPNFGSFSLTPFLDKSILNTNKLREVFDKQNTELITNYLKDLGVNYSTMAGLARLGTMLGMLQSSFTVGDKTATPYASQISKYFTPMLNGTYYINGSANKETGRYAFYTPKQIGAYAPGIHEVSILDLDDPTVRQVFGVVQSNKQGGIIEKFDGGGEISDLDWANYLNKVEPKATKTSTLTETIPQDTNEKLDLGDIANIAGPLALDITSMISANGVGIGSLVSAGTGVASTIWLGVNDWDSNNILGSLGSIGANLLADGVGLVPGLGIAGKVGKIAKGLAKNAKYFGYAFNAIGAKDASLVLYKGVKNGFDLSPDEWKTLAYGLAGVAQGAAGVKRANRTNLKREAATQQVYNSTNKKGETYPVVVGIEDATPGKTGKRRYIANKNDILEVREKTLTPDWSDSMDRSFVKIMQQPRSSVILHPWESLNNPFRNPFSLEKSRNKFNSFAELWRKRKSKSSNTTETPSEKYGGILKALRNGGIIKAVDGTKMTGIDFVDGSSWYDNVFSNYKLNILDTLKSDNSKKYYTWLNDMQDSHSEIYNMAGGDSKAWIKTAYANDAVKNYQSVYGNNLWGLNFNELGIAKANNESAQGGLPLRYNLGNNKRITTDNSKNNWAPDGLYSAITDDRRLLGRVGDYTPELLKNFLDELKTLGYNLIEGTNGYYKLDPIVASTPKNNPVSSKDTKKENNVKVADSEKPIDTLYNTNFKNPTDPTPFIIGAKTIQGLLGNKNIYGNLLDEMPQAPLRDPINRQLAIVGWQEQIKQGQNQLADLRHATWMQHGSDQQTNLAGMHEVENKGRDIMNDKLMKDSGRQFETAQKLWNLKNEDVLYNLGVGDANRRSIADRARMMALIRAAWRSGDNNILMGALSDTGNWLLKKYQREQDIVDLAREQLLGTKELFMEDYLRLKNPNYEALKSEYETTKDINRKKLIATLILEMQLEALRKAPSAWALKIYSNFHNPGFGGGYKETLVPLSKHGSKLEVAKLKARGKDNDRYVSMMKDLRKSSYRRRRR